MYSAGSGKHYQLISASSPCGEGLCVVDCSVVCFLMDVPSGFKLQAWLIARKKEL